MLVIDVSELGLGHEEAFLHVNGLALGEAQLLGAASQVLHFMLLLCGERCAVSKRILEGVQPLGFGAVMGFHFVQQAPVMQNASLHDCGWDLRDECATGG